MKISANTIYEAALGLLGLIGTDGRPCAAADSLRQNALACLNSVIAEVSGYNETLTGSLITPARLGSLNDEIDCDEFLCGSVIPFGLARRLAVRFDPELAAFYKSEFYDSLKLLRTRFKAKGEAIGEVY